MRLSIAMVLCRRQLVRSIGALLAAGVVLVALAPSAEARRYYCSPSGDYCLGTYINGNGKRVFELRAFFGPRPILICVTRRSEVCRHRRLVRQGDIYVNRVLWRSFPYQGHGRYIVRWYVDFGGSSYDRIGKDISF